MRLRAAALTLATLVVLSSAGAGQVASAAEPLSDKSVTVKVLSVTPSTPKPTQTPARLTVRLQLANTTDQTLPDVEISAERGNPINSEKALDSAIAKPTPGDPNLVSPITTLNGDPVKTSIPARGAVTVAFVTTTSVVFGGPTGLCLCHDSIYPLYFRAVDVTPDGTTTLVGTAQTYVPAFGVSPPALVHVSWVWPILDRPHRLFGDTTFLDDDLATSVSVGRLDRVLQVLQDVGHTVAMTVVIDPELIDELAVMSTGKYTVRTRTSVGQVTEVSGTGQAAATRWLARLRAVLDSSPGIDAQATPFADPNIDSLSRNGLPWTLALPPAGQARVLTALGGRVLNTTFSWPPDESLGTAGLDAVQAAGATTVLLNDKELPADSPTPNALAPVSTSGGPLTAAITSTAIQHWVTPVLSIGGTGLTDLPKLVSQVAIRAATDPTVTHFVVISAPRYVDPAPAIATAAIHATTRTIWSTSTSIAAAEQTFQPVDRGAPIAPTAPVHDLPQSILDVAQRVTTSVASLRSMFADATDSALLDTFPPAAQRAASAGWGNVPPGSVSLASALDAQLDALENGVFIVKPANGTYTLASQNAPLPITINNTLGAPVMVRVTVSTVNDQPGFHAEEPDVQTIPAASKVTLRVRVHVQRTGRFQVEAQLWTPIARPLGAPVELSIHSTALGTIGVVITAIAAGVLVLALVVRVTRRLRAGKPPAAETPTRPSQVSVP